MRVEVGENQQVAPTLETPRASCRMAGEPGLLAELLSIICELLPCGDQVVRPPHVGPAAGNGGGRLGELPTWRGQRAWGSRVSPWALGTSSRWEPAHQLMCWTPPSRSCLSCTCLWMAFLRSRTVAFCTTTTAAGNAGCGGMPLQHHTLHPNPVPGMLPTSKHPTPCTPTAWSQPGPLAALTHDLAIHLAHSDCHCLAIFQGNLGIDLLQSYLANTRGCV